jgi:hypothetical protein
VAPAAPPPAKSGRSAKAAAHAAVTSASTAAAVATPAPPTATAPAHQNRPKVHLMEIDHGAFGRVVELPRDVQRDAISARYVNGMLWIELPKK